MKTPKIFLIQTGGGITPRGIYAQQHNLQNHGYVVESYTWFDYLQEEDIIKFCERLEKNDVVGISTTFMTEFGKRKLRILVDIAKNKGCFIVSGGVRPFKDDFYVDKELIGSYSEDTFLDFLNSKFGRIKKIPYSIANDDFTWHKKGFLTGNALPIEVSRHCVFNCSFCSFPNRGIKTWPNRNPQLMKEELLSAYYLHGVKNFMLTCSTFNDRIDKLNEIFDVCDELPFDATFAAYMRLDLLMKQKEIWPRIKKYVRFMVFGIETFNKKSGISIGKGTDPEKVKSWLREVRDYFDDCHLYSGFIVGLPFSDPEEHERDKEFLEKEKVLDGFNWNALCVDSGLNGKDFTSKFDTTIQNYGYKILITDQIHKFGTDASWIREDGQTYENSWKIANDLNEKRYCCQVGFSTIGLLGDYSMQQIKKMKTAGEMLVFKNTPIEYQIMDNTNKQKYWDYHLNNPYEN